MYRLTKIKRGRYKGLCDLRNTRCRTKWYHTWENPRCQNCDNLPYFLSKLKCQVTKSSLQVTLQKELDALIREIREVDPVKFSDENVFQAKENKSPQETKIVKREEYPSWNINRLSNRFRRKMKMSLYDRLCPTDEQ